MNSKVFCGGLPWEAGESDLKDAMGEFGIVEEAIVITDRETGKSKGFGFVTFSNSKEAQRAVDAGQVQMGERTVRIDLAHDRPPRNRRGPPPGEPFRGRGRGGGRRYRDDDY